MTEIDLLTADAVAELLGVTPAWVYAQSRAGTIPTVKLGRYYRYSRTSLERWIVTQEVGG
jgi:excisionase family DNA binding protein